MARAVNRSHWGLVSSVAWRNMPGRAGGRDGVQAAGLSADPLPGHLEVFSAIAFADDRRYPLAGPARALGPRSPPALSPGTAAFPAADTEAGCPQSLGREAGILAGVLEATACDPPKLKPARQTT
jgi:hypothetical protein